MVYIGIDIAKETHTVTAIDDEGKIIRKPFTFANNQAGFMELGEILGDIKDDLRIAF